MLNGKLSAIARARGYGWMVVAAAVTGVISPAVWGTPYASGVSVSGTTVNFTLNEPADSLQVSINGGAPVALDGSSSGIKTFSLSSPSDTFSITAKKTDGNGYAVANGSTVAAATNGLSQATAGSWFNLISSDANPLTNFNSPRGVTVGLNPNLSNFGTAYIANSAAGTTNGRSVGDGLYAVRADQTDAFGWGDSAQTGGLTFGNSTSSPFRIHAASDGNIYVSDFSDANGQVGRLNTILSSGELVLAGVGGPSAVPAGQNHGSTTAAYAEIAPGGGLTLYTLDEDLTTSNVTGSGSTTDKNSLWRYSIGTSTLPYSDMPTKVNKSNVLLPAATSDLDKGADGKFYLAQTRSAGKEAGLIVLSPDGDTLFDSLTATRTLLSDPAAADIYRNVQAIAVSPDQKYLAVMVNDSDVSVIPLVNGIPDLAQRLIVDTGPDITSGRDIAFDAADNIHYVSSGQGLYRVLSPGGDMETTLSFDGTNYTFTNGAVPEPGSLCVIGLGLVGMGLRRRRR
jgi:hypothetical protein